MKVLCLLTLLTAVDGNSDFFEIINEIFGIQNSTNVTTSDYLNFTNLITMSDYRNSTNVTMSDDRNSTAMTTSDSRPNFTDFATLAKIIAEISKPKSKSRLRMTVSNSTANLCNYTKEYLQTLLGDWILIKFYSRNLQNNIGLGPFAACFKIRLVPSKGICKCRDKYLPVFNVAISTENVKTKYIKEVAVAFVSHYKDAIKFGNVLCQCKRIIVTGRVLSNNYILLYDNVSNKTDITYFVILARNLSAMWELEKLEKTTPELVHRKGKVLCEGVVFYTTLKSVENKINIKQKALKLGFGLSSLSFFDYLNIIPKEEVVDIAISSGVAI